jgi:tol-pal system protein YbgF
MSASMRAVLAMASCALLLPACGGAQKQKELDGLRQEIARIQRENEDLARRVGELESKDSPSASSNGDATPSATNADEPKALKVVKLEPAAASTVTTNAGTTMVAAPIDDDAPRPLLKIGPDGISETFPDEGTSTTSKAPKIDPKAAKDYDAALALYKGKKWQKALDAFAGFVVRWPDHPYVGNALYWRGACYYSLGQFGAAEGQLEGLLASHPESTKVPDALLELGLTEKKLGSDAKAKAAFVRLKTEFPKSEAAKKIPPEDAS